MGKPEPVTTGRKLIIYSDLSKDFFNALAESFVKEKNSDIQIVQRKELDGSEVHADMVLSNSIVLNELVKDGSLETLDLPYFNGLNKEFFNVENKWIGIFYDSVVLVINREYARKYGQVHLSGWKDLAKIKKMRIVLEHFNASDIQNNILACYASNMGEKETFKYFSHLNKFVVQYSKFPFSPVRMIAAGEADLAITRRSNLYEFSDNDFPAYFIEPEEGTPIIVYGAGIFKGSANSTDAREFIDWLCKSQSAKNIALQEETGYKFIDRSANTRFSKNFWLNTSYKDTEDLHKLVLKWYGKVRFGKYVEN